MPIDIATARSIVRLTRIGVDEAELPAVAQEIGTMLASFDQLNEVNVEGVEPMTNPTSIHLVLRADEVSDGEMQEAVLSNAPDAREGFYAVPKVVE